MASDITCGIGGIRVHIFYLQTTQQLPKKHHEAGPPEQLPTDALSQSDYGHTRHCEDCKEVFWGGICMHMAKWEMSPPPPPTFQDDPPLWHKEVSTPVAPAMPFRRNEDLS